MSIAMWNEIQAAHAKIRALESALAEKAVAVEHATKDDLDVFLGRLRALEDRVATIARKLKL